MAGVVAAAARVAAGRLLRETSAVFVCDVQKRFEKVIPKMDNLIRTSAMVVRAAAELDIPVVVTEQSPKKLLETSLPVRDVLPAGTPVFAKTSFSMLTPEVIGTLDEELGEVTSVVLLGIEAHVCVFQTALDLLERGYSVHIVADAVSSQSDLDRLFAFERLKQSGAFLTTAEAVLFEWVRDAEHPSFRAISKLAKAHTGHGTKPARL